MAHIDSVSQVSSHHCYSRRRSVRRSCTCFFGTERHSEPTVISHDVHARSAANDFWGKTYLKLTGESKMNQQLSILTGCSAGATESFVVVPFELVKIRCVCWRLREACEAHRRS